MIIRFITCMFIIQWCSMQASQAESFASGYAALEKMAGCFLVDYNYTEMEVLKPDYSIDKRVYDVNTERSVKEWIYLERITSTNIRLQHVLFATAKDGALLKDRMLKHQAEDWDYGASAVFDFEKPDTWRTRSLPAGNDLWTRRITNLDDGLRYQCAAKWSKSAAYPEWSCDNYAPIPGREMRDMKRSDYNTMRRSTRIIVYGDSWLERQNNVKVTHTAGKQTALAAEAGKNWYVRLADAECDAARAFSQPRMAFWSLLRQTWEGVLASGGEFRETKATGSPPLSLIHI